jgi:hypothetical protein
LILPFSDFKIEVVFYSDKIENRLVCKMYTKSELESKTFKELKRLAREKNICQCWTSKVITNSMPSHSLSLRCVLILTSYWCLGIARDLFTSGSHNQHYSFVFVHTWHLPSPSHHPSFDRPNNIWWGVHIMKLCIVQFSSVSNYCPLGQMSYWAHFSGKLSSCV